MIETFLTQIADKELARTVKYNLPFPMAVFGTLRKGRGNSYLMGGTDDKAAVRYSDHRLAFLPNFAAKGLKIYQVPGASCPFEIFDYTPEQWRKMIRSVDALEGFRPSDQDVPAQGGWYWRTLAKLSVLPMDYQHELFTEVNLWDERNLKIPSQEWDHYPTVPCWIYSSVSENKAVAQQSCNPILWY